VDDGSGQGDGLKVLAGRQEAIDDTAGSFSVREFNCQVF
jgi:hypothetical protein